MELTHSVLLTGASGAGKSTLIRGALEHYGSGLVVLAPGTDEDSSYVGLLNNPAFKFKGFDDVEFQATVKGTKATGHDEMIKWLRERYAEVKSDVEAGLPPRYAVLGVDTLSAVGRLAYNATLARFGLTEPPPAIGSSGAPFYSYLRIILESGVRVMRGLRGLGVHWIVASHPTEAETTAIQQTANAPSGSKIMPDLPGGFKNQLPSFFTTVLHVDIGQKGIHFVRWGGDQKRVTKSRLGDLGGDGKFDLPVKAKDAWELVASRIEAAMARLVNGS
jgi:energy-coupling factor transporter ATP-binding protein EcfA2